MAWSYTASQLWPFLLDVFVFCTTFVRPWVKNHVFVWPWLRHTHTQKHTTMSDISHGLCIHPWQSTAGFGMMHMLAMSWQMLVTLGLFLFVCRGVSSVTFFTSACERDFFLTLVMFAAASATARHCPLSNAAQRACLPYYGWCRACTILLNLCCGGFFGWQNVHHWKKERVKGPRP